MLLKKIAAFAAAALACVSLAGCGSAKDITVDVNALAAELRDGIAYQDELESIDSAMISMVYDVGDEVEEAVVYMGSGGTAEEIAVFACKDADAAKNQVTPVVKQHIEDQITSFESYVPGEVAKLKDAVVRTVGRYVAVCVSDDSAAAEKILDKYMK